MSTIIAVANQKGGVGKTTSVINIAAFLAKTSTVLVVDLDPQGNTTSGLGVDKALLAASSYEFLLGTATAETAILHTAYQNLHLVPAHANLAAVELELATRPRREFVLKQLCMGLQYDYILFDCPPSLGLLTINGLVAAQWLLVPTQAEFYALEGLSQLLNTFSRVRQALNPQLKLLGVLVTMYDARISLSNQVILELNKHFGDLVFDTRVPRNIRLAEAPSHGKPIMYYDRFCRGTKAYKKLTKEVVDRVRK